MLKKMVILAVVGFVAVTALKGTKAVSYLKSEWNSATKQAEDSIPPETELARLKNEVELLEKDGKKLNHQLAKEMVEVRNLQADADKLAANQSKFKAAIQVRAEAIKNSTEQVTYDNRTMTVAAAKAKLESDVKVYTDQQKVLEVKESELATRIRVRDDLARQREAMESQKDELKAALGALEAEITLHKLKQVESKVQTDDSRLAKIKEDVRALRKRLDIKNEELKLSQPTRDESVTVPNIDKSVDDITAPLNTPAKKPETKTDSKLPIVD